MHHQPRCEFRLPASFLDLFMLIALVVMLELRDQGVLRDQGAAFQMPRLVEGDAAAAAAATLASSVSQHVELRSDGRLLLNESEVAVDELVERLGQTDEAEAIELAIEIDEAGQGATEVLLRVQMALSRANLLNRVRLAASERKRGEP